MTKYTGKNSGDRSVVVGQYKEVPTSLADGERAEVRIGPSSEFLTAPAVNEPGSVGSNEDLFVVGKPADAGTIGRTASVLLFTGPCVLKGFTIVSHTAGATVRFSDALTSTTPFVASAFTTVAGHLAGLYIPVGKDGISMVTGCFVTITGTIEIIPDVTSLL